ncbi:MAG TPA: amidase family protein [Actinophytocola sp.]|uniref:amidase n=1 Tax=Actinophytocola sp. TaxID=1872138 RepID=UPI002DDCD28D|nr:amidase family protein [Actinophytocola sp.]HEV2780538.1 amidase family protein [Actinophytocola sp.]
MTRLGIRETRALFARGEISVADHIQALLARIRKVDGELGAYVSVADEQAMIAAEAADARIRARGRTAWRDQPLLGVPIAVKDLIQTRDLPTSRGSLLDNPRARVDPPAVARMRAAGAIVIGKTTTSEYGWSGSTVCRVTPPTRNPWDTRLSTGGSSGGSAAAVAAGLCAAALGTDGGGSIRIPAAFCGVVGYKPTFGRIPYVPVSSDRLSHLGPMTHTVTDALELTNILGGPHELDPDTLLDAVNQPRDCRSLRIGWLEFPGTTEEIRRVTERAIPLLTGLGHRVERRDVPFRDPYPFLVDIIAAGEAAGTAPEDDEWCDQGRLVIVHYGRSMSAATLRRAEEARLALRTTLQSVMDRYDVLAMATVPIEPFEADAIGPAWAADPKDLQWLAWTPATYPFNLTGHPAISVPVGRTRAGLPVGLQLVGPIGADDGVLWTARRIEGELDQLPAPPEVE